MNKGLNFLNRISYRGVAIEVSPELWVCFSHSNRAQHFSTLANRLWFYQYEFLRKDMPEQYALHISEVLTYYFHPLYISPYLTNSIANSSRLEYTQKVM